jgi:hypothetical protein
MVKREAQRQFYGEDGSSSTGALQYLSNSSYVGLAL